MENSKNITFFIWKNLLILHFLYGNTIIVAVYRGRTAYIPLLRNIVNRHTGGNKNGKIGNRKTLKMEK